MLEAEAETSRHREKPRRAFDTVKWQELQALQSADGVEIDLLWLMLVHSMIVLVACKPSLSSYRAKHPHSTYSCCGELTRPLSLAVQANVFDLSGSLDW